MSPTRRATSPKEHPPASKTRTARAPTQPTTPHNHKATTPESTQQGIQNPPPAQNTATNQMSNDNHNHNNNDLNVHNITINSNSSNNVNNNTEDMINVSPIHNGPSDSGSSASPFLTAHLPSTMRAPTTTSSRDPLGPLSTSSPSNSSMAATHFQLVSVQLSPGEAAAMAATIANGMKESNNSPTTTPTHSVPMTTTTTTTRTMTKTTVGGGVGASKAGVGTSKGGVGAAKQPKR